MQITYNTAKSFFKKLVSSYSVWAEINQLRSVYVSAGGGFIEELVLIN